MPRLFPVLLILLSAVSIAAAPPSKDESRQPNAVSTGAKPADPTSSKGNKNGKKTPAPHLVETITVVSAPRAIERVELGALRHRRTVRIFNQEEGRIAEAPWFEADRVAKGERLIRLDAALIRAQMDKARAETRQADLDLQRLNQLAVQRLASEDEIAHARTALNVARAEEKILATRLGYMTIHAPFAGVVTERRAEPGDAVGKHSHLLTLADPDSLLTEVRVSELMLPHLNVGDPVQIRIDALGPGAFEGRIRRIHPEIEVATRRGVVEAELNPVPPGVRAGQFCRVTLRSRAVERRLIPFAAVRRDRLGEYVFKLEKGNRTKRAGIVTGLRFGNEVEVLEGLETGDRIVLQGFLGLRDGKKVQPVSSGLRE